MNRKRWEGRVRSLCAKKKKNVSQKCWEGKKGERKWKLETENKRVVQGTKISEQKKRLWKRKRGRKDSNVYGRKREEHVVQNGKKKGNWGYNGRKMRNRRDVNTIGRWKRVQGRDRNEAEVCVAERKLNWIGKKKKQKCWNGKNGESVRKECKKKWWNSRQRKSYWGKNNGRGRGKGALGESVTPLHFPHRFNGWI